MTERPIPLDEYPIHQAPVSMRHVATSDRNAYDRSIFQVFDHYGRAVLIAGVGVYPNLGVIDAYCTVTRPGVQHAVRASDALSTDRMAQAVGPIRIEVEEPLRRLRIVCDPDQAGDGGLSVDVIWEAISPPVWEPHHVMRSGDRQILDGRRFVQGGTARGTIRVGGEEIEVVAGDWSATRDRSWGVRTTGTGETPGRFAEEGGLDGFWWVWCPIQFDDHFVMVIAQEDADGYRTLSEAVRVWDPSLGRPDENLGWPLLDIGYRSGTRWPLGATVGLIDRERRPFELRVETLAGNSLALGNGYPPDAGWSHGEWKGRGWVERLTYDLTDPAQAGLAAFGVIDHSARVTYTDADGAEHVGWGIFEHGSIGRHTPTGMTDLSSVAP